MSNIVRELKRRKVFRVGATYLVLGWVLIQVAETIAPMMNLSDTAPRFVLFLLIVMFPIALFSAWAFEIRPTMGGEGAAESVSVLLPVVASVIVLGLVGYLLVWSNAGAPVESGNATESVNVVAVTEPAPGSIAVLPFADLSPSGDQEFFGDGIAEELLNVLANVDELSVASRTSAMRRNLGAPEMRHYEISQSNSTTTPALVVSGRPNRKRN